MRSDLHEVLIERPRSGMRRKTARDSKPKAREWTGSEDDFAHSYRPRRQRDKHFDDLISPLRRWLRHQVGRPWDTVWSELCRGIDTRSVVGRHLLDHVRGEVSLDCYYDVSRRRFVAKHVRRGHDLVDGLYVDPRHGLLCWRQPAPRRRTRRRMDLPADTRQITDTRFQLKRSGIWFEAEVALLLTTPGSRVEPDIRWYTSDYTIVRKRQLNSRELRDNGLTNDDA
jgi:hypothetical protein